MSKTNVEGFVLPALRGIMGKWVYYSCLMPLDEIAARVRYADEIHEHKALSDMIQRKLKTGRSKEIAAYLENQPDRFFNSLVVATYKGEPNWIGLTDLRAKKSQVALADLSEETVASVGFLTLRGDEELFALDGQHRLAGIKRAFDEGVQDESGYDEISVIFVSHKDTKVGLERTRRLFTTLNKTARPVSKGDIIALDEDDVMALSVRWLIEHTRLFSGKRIAFVATNNLPTTNKSSLTTIGNLYDLLLKLFTQADTELQDTRVNLTRVRPVDDDLKAYFELSKNYFTLMKKHFPELKSFFEASDSTVPVSKFRGNHGGSALYRPIGLDIFTQVIARLTKEMSLSKAVKLASKLPTDLSKAPYKGLLWDTDTQRIVGGNRVTLRETLLHMLGKSKFSEEKLLARYRSETGDEKAKLPGPIG